MSEAIELANARIFKHMGHRGDSEGSSRCVCGADMRSEAGQRICPRAEYIHIDVHRSEVQSLVNNFSGMKNGAKIRKKVNQIYGRQLGDLAKDAKKELDAEIARRLAHFNGMVKTKPRWVPTWAWKILLDIVLKSDTMV
jgi:hypothetical protein